MRDGVHTIARFASMLILPESRPALENWRWPMKCLTTGAAILLGLCTASCATDSEYDRHGAPRDAKVGRHYEYSLLVPPMDPNRRIVMMDCRNSYTTDGGNLRCM